MTTIVRDIFVFITAAIFVAAAVLITTGAGAHEFKVGALDIGHPWSRPTPKDANIAGGYLTITNKGKTADRLIGGASPAAGQIEVHEVVDVDGMAKTRPLANGIEIRPGKTIELKPGALRIVPTRPEDQGHAGVREGRARRDRLQRRGKSWSRRQWRRGCQRATQAPLGCVVRVAFAALKQQRRRVFGVARRTNNAGPSRSAMTGLIILQPGS
jgi:copper(I)-binding protein